MSFPLAGRITPEIAQAQLDERCAPKELTELETRALLAFFDRQQDQEAHMTRVAHEVALDILEAHGAEVTKLEPTMAFFTVDGIEFKVTARPKRPDSTSNSGIAGIHDEEEYDLHTYRTTTWHPIKELADLGRVLKL